MKMKLRLNVNIIYLSLIMLPYLKPYNVTLIPWLDNIFKVWKAISTLIVLIRFLKSKKTLHTQSIYLICFLLVWSISVIVNKAPVEFGSNILSIMGILLLFEEQLENNHFKKNISEVLYSISSIYIPLNLITVIIGRPFLSYGMKLDDNANFLGGDNYSAFILIPLCGFLFLYDMQLYNKIRIRTWFVAILGLICLIIPFVLTGMIVYMLLLISVAFFKFPFWEKVLKWRNVVILSVCFIISIAFLDFEQVIVGWLGLLDKVGFNGRNMIWPLAINAIMMKPLIGYGGIDAELANSWLIAGANHTHNLILEFPFSTGFIGSIFFALYFHSILKKTRFNNNKNMKVLLLSLSAYLFCAIFDFYIGLIYFYLLLDMIWLYKLKGTNHIRIVDSDKTL